MKLFFAVCGRYRYSKYLKAFEMGYNRRMPKQKKLEYIAKQEQLLATLKTELTESITESEDQLRSVVKLQDKAIELEVRLQEIKKKIMLEYEDDNSDGTTH